MNDSDHIPTPLRDWLAALFLTESAAVMIALVSPLTPSKTGSDRSPAELFWQEPSYAQEAIVAFVGVNALLILIGLIAWIAVKMKSTAGSDV